MEIKNPESPATKRQRWALYCITGKDFRNITLTKEEAFRMIADAKEQTKEKSKTISHKQMSESDKLKYRIKEIQKWILENGATEIGEAIKKEINISAIVEDDETTKTDNSKKYIFLGSGCGFVTLQYDRRKKKVAEYERAYKLVVIENDTFATKLAKKALDSKTIKYLRSIGNNPEALIAQNIGVKFAMMGLFLDFLRSKKIDTSGIYINKRLD